jgi:chromosome segregation ATPase
MSADEQDVLTQALTRLQGELEQFDGVQKALKGAHQRLVEAEQEWGALTAEQQRMAAELVKMTKAAIEATQAVTERASALTSALIPLAKAIENVNFPLRLDKLDMAVTTHASALSSLQNQVDRRFDEIKQVDDRTAAVIASVHRSVARYGWATVLIALLNVAGVVAILLKLFYPV